MPSLGCSSEAPPSSPFLLDLPGAAARNLPAVRAADRQAPEAADHSHHHSPLVTRHSPLSTHHSPLTAPSLTTHHAPRTTHCPLPIAQASSGSCRPADTSSASAPTACSRRCASGSGATRRSLPLGSPTPSTRSSSVRVRVRVRASNPNPNPSPSPNPNPNPNQAWSSATSRASSHG